MEATKKAVHILSTASKTTHPYLEMKGFPTQKGFVWHDLLVVPMRVGENLCGCQLIDPLGNKRFLSGQRTSGAKLTIDNKGIDFLVEGYATGLSLRAVLRHLKLRYRIHICFSAGNMKKIATNFKTGIVVADNDESGTGERIAKEIGWDYWLSPEIGDMNDFHQKYGIDLLGKNFSEFLR
jgi:putative DNA primase/helicase